MISFTQKNDETKRNTEFLQPHPVAAVEALLEIGTMAVLSLDEHLSQTNTPCVPEFC
jgi:hypothetical protein